MAATKKHVIVSLILVQFSLIGCGNDKFKQSCLESRVILEHAMSLLIPSVEKNTNNDQKGIIIKNDNSRAIEYLRKKDQELRNYYSMIKGYIAHSNRNYDDALYAASYINEVYYFLTGRAFDDRCYYIQLIEKNKNVHLSDWLINDFFAPLKEEVSYKKSWTNLDYEKKREIILRILTEARKDC
jgi:hypothetical protein